MSRQGSRTPTVNAEAAERADAARRQTLELMHTRLVDQISALQSDGQWQRWLTFARSCAAQRGGRGGLRVPTCQVAAWYA